MRIILAKLQFLKLFLRTKIKKSHLAAARSVAASVLMIFTAFLLAAQPALALTNAQLKQFSQNNILFYDPNGTDCTSVTVRTDLVGTGNIEKVMSYFSGNNPFSITLTKEGIAGVLANFQNESAFSAFRNQNQYASTTGDMSSGNGYGIAQFTGRDKILGPLRTDARTAGYFSEYYKQEYGGTLFQDGKPGQPVGVPDEVNDAWLAVELDFVVTSEMTTTKVGSYRNYGGTMGLDYISDNMTILEAMNAARSASDAARIWVWIYERPGDKPGAAASRGTLAEDTYLSMVENYLGSGGGRSSGGSNSPSATAGANGNNVTIIGDSITNRTRNNNGFEANLSVADIYAQDSKHMFNTVGDNKSGSEIIDDLISSGNLRDIAVIALGTNDQGGLTQANLQGLVDKINRSGAHQIVFVNNFAKSGSGYDFTSNNNAMTAVANNNDNVVVANWAAAAGANENMYLDDAVHPTYGDGVVLFAQTIYSAVTTGVTGSNTREAASRCGNNGSTGGNGVTSTTINGYTYAFPIAGATKANYLRNTDELRGIFSGYSQVSVLSAPTGWFHHHGRDYVTNEPSSADMGIAYRMTGNEERTAQYYIDKYGATSEYANRTTAPYYASSGAKVVATIGGNLHWYNESRNGYSFCSDLSIAGDDGHTWYYIHILRDDNLYSRESRRVEMGEVIGEIGTPECADTTQSHLHFMIDGSTSGIEIGNYLNPLFEALPADAAELARRESASTAVAEGGLTETQARTFMINYGANKNNSSANATGRYWDMCGGGGSNCVTFSDFFLNKFTSTSGDNLPNGKDVVGTLASRGVTTGTEPQVWSVFSWDNGGAGHTGVILGYQDGVWIVGHASCTRGNNGKRGAGDGTTSGSGSGVVVTSTDIMTAIWGGSGVTNVKYAYLGDQVDTAAISNYLINGE